MVAGGMYVLLVLLAIFSDHLIFQPHPAAYRLATLALEAGGPVETYRIPTAYGAIAAAWLPNPQARYTLLYSHGNGEDLGDDIAILAEYRRAGFAVFAYDYNGYGLSQGRPTEAAVYGDVEAAYGFLTTQLHVPPAQVISFGHSLGAAAAIHLAAHRPVAGLIAHAPFVSAFRLVTQVQIVPWDKFNNASEIQRVHCPVLVIHGRRDEVIAFRQGERIFRLANEPKRFLRMEEAHHNDTMILESGVFLRGIREFAAGL
jgi:hypothetical protein